MLLRIGGEAAGHELAGPVIAADFLLGQCRRCALVGAIHDVPEFVQQREGQGKRDEVEHRLVLDISQAVAVSGRLGDVRRPGNLCGLFGRDERLSGADALLVIEFVLPPFGIDLEGLIKRHSGPCRHQQGRRIHLDGTPCAEAEQPEKVDRLGVELDALVIGLHRHALGARRDFHTMTILAP